MRFWKISGWVTLSLGILLVVLLGAVATVMIFGVTVNLDGMRYRVDVAITEALSREVAIEGSVELVISLSMNSTLNGRPGHQSNSTQPGTWPRSPPGPMNRR